MSKIGHFFVFLMKYRYYIYYYSIGFTIATLIYAISLPNTYTATTQIMPQQESSGMIGLTLAAGMGETGSSKIAKMAKLAGLSAGYTTADVTKAFLSSRSVGENVITDCNLFDIFKIRKRSMESALKTLSEITKMKVTPEDLVIVSVTTKDPHLSAKIANAYIEYLNIFLKEQTKTRGKNERIFLEARLSTAETELELAEESLRVFQEKYRVIAPDKETEIAIETYVQLKTALIQKEIEADITLQFTQQDNPYSMSLRRNIDEYKKELAKIETGNRSKSGFGVGFSVSLESLPDVQYRYIDKYRDMRIKEEVAAFLWQEYEQARITEVRDTPVITIVDEAKPPEKKSGPHRTLIILLGLFCGFFFGFANCYLMDIWANLKRNTELHTSIMQLRNVLGKDIKSILNFFTRRKK